MLLLFNKKNSARAAGARGFFSNKNRNLVLDLGILFVGLQGRDFAKNTDWFANMCVF